MTPDSDIKLLYNPILRKMFSFISILIFQLYNTKIPKIVLTKKYAVISSKCRNVLSFNIHKSIEYKDTIIINSYQY